MSCQAVLSALYEPEKNLKRAWEYMENRIAFRERAAEEGGYAPFPADR